MLSVLLLPYLPVILLQIDLCLSFLRNLVTLKHELPALIIPVRVHLLNHLLTDLGAGYGHLLVLLLSVKHHRDGADEIHGGSLALTILAGQLFQIPEDMVPDIFLDALVDVVYIYGNVQNLIMIFLHQILVIN